MTVPSVSIILRFYCIMRYGVDYTESMQVLSHKVTRSDRLSIFVSLYKRNNNKINEGINTFTALRAGSKISNINISGFCGFIIRHTKRHGGGGDGGGDDDGCDGDDECGGDDVCGGDDDECGGDDDECGGGGDDECGGGGDGDECGGGDGVVGE